MEVAPTSPPGTAQTAHQLRAEEDARETERRRDEDSEIERREAEPSEAGRGVGQRVDIRV